MSSQWPPDISSLKSYMIYYRPHDQMEGIVVVRVLNATQNITELHFE
jgi:plasmid stabilization system protein ParE